VIVVLQLCQFAFLERTTETEIYKDRFRQQFLDFGSKIIFQVGTRGHLAEMFDPRTGLPVTSPSGSMRLSDVKVVGATLGYTIDRRGQCAAIVHPTWGKAVYPSTIVSSAQPDVVTEIVACIAAASDSPHHSNRTRIEPENLKSDLTGEGRSFLDPEPV
jgi:hypothetical protein